MAVQQELPRSFRRIMLELAREPGHPAGDPQSGYQIVVPLTDDRRIDAGLWDKYRDNYRVTRFRADGERDIGHVLHRPGGSWAFHYDISGEEDDETGYRLKSERFDVGEYVSIKDDTGMHTYVITLVDYL